MRWGICRWMSWGQLFSSNWSAPVMKRGSIILTSNKSYGEWGSIFGDPIIATAILDRLLHHSTTVNIRGESYRLKERRKAGLLPTPEAQHAEPIAAAPNNRSKRGHSA